MDGAYGWILWMEVMAGAHGLRLLLARAHGWLEVMTSWTPWLAGAYDWLGWPEAIMA